MKKIFVGIGIALICVVVLLAVYACLVRFGFVRNIMSQQSAQDQITAEKREFLLNNQTVQTDTQIQNIKKNFYSSTEQTEQTEQNLVDKASFQP